LSISTGHGLAAIFARPFMTLPSVPPRMLRALVTLNGEALPIMYG
jgi:hypothetical protein